MDRGLLKFLQLNRFQPCTFWSFPHSQLFSEKRKEKKNEGMEGLPKNSFPPSFRVSCSPECFHSNSSSLALFTMRAAFFPLFLPADLTFFCPLLFALLVCPFNLAALSQPFSFARKRAKKNTKLTFFFFALSDFSTLSQAPPP